MKIKLIILLLISYSVIFTGCKPKCKGDGGHKEYLVPEDKKFLLNDGDTLIFKTENDLYDTMTVNGGGSEFYHYLGCVNDKLTDIYYENYVITINNLDSTLNLQSFFILQAGFDTFLSIKINNTFFIGVSKITNYQYNDSIYEDVFVADNDSISVYLNKKYGIIAHQAGNEEMYHLFKYIENNKNKSNE